MQILMSPWLRLALLVMLGLLLLEPTRLLLGVEPLAKTQATLVSVSTVQSHGRGPSGLLLSYRDQDHVFTYTVDGKEYTTHIRRPEQTHEVGETITITYFERNPKSILLVDGSLLHFPYVRLVAIKLVLSVLLALTIQAHRTKRREAVKAKAEALAKS